MGAADANVRAMPGELLDADVGDLTFDVRVDGPDDGRPVLLLHGFPETSASWAKVTPLLGGAFLLAGLSALALPGMSTFVSEFLVLLGTFTRHKALAVVADRCAVLS